MENKNLEEKKVQTKYEEMEQVEEYGNGRDFVEGVAVGVCIVGGVVALT